MKLNWTSKSGRTARDTNSALGQCFFRVSESRNEPYEKYSMGIAPIISFGA